MRGRPANRHARLAVGRRARPPHPPAPLTPPRSHINKDDSYRVPKALALRMIAQHPARRTRAAAATGEGEGDEAASSVASSEAASSVAASSEQEEAVEEEEEAEEVRPGWHRQHPGGGVRAARRAPLIPPSAGR